MYLVSLQGQGTSFSPFCRGAPTECRHRTKPASAPIFSSTSVSDPRHDAHADDDIGGVGDLDAEHRLVGVQAAHHEGDDVHRPPAHRAPVEVGHRAAHLVGVHPVVGGPRVGLVAAADERAALDAGDVRGVGGAPEAVDLLGETDEGARGDQSPGQLLVLRLAAVDPADRVRLRQLGHLADPGEQRGVGGGWIVGDVDGLVGRRLRSEVRRGHEDCLSRGRSRPCRSLWPVGARLLASMTLCERRRCRSRDALTVWVSSSPANRPWR